MKNKTIVELLTAKQLTIAAAESCTGGDFIASIIRVPGASAVVHASFITYANEAKIKYAHVDPSVLLREGAVSQATAEAMAKGAASEANASVGVGITGVAGPLGGSPEKPVGTVWISTVYNNQTQALLFTFGGDREAIQAQAVNAASDMVIEALQ
jgi:competence/damage-inducible protein CinA C-terminal domain